MEKPLYPEGYDKDGHSLHYKYEYAEWKPSNGPGFFSVIGKNRKLRFGEASDVRVINISHTLHPELFTPAERTRPLYALKEYIRTSFGDKGVPVYIFDDHNHALYGWYEALKEGKITPGATLYHFDDHPDDLAPAKGLLLPQNPDLSNMAHYAQSLAINTFIDPARTLGIIDQTNWFQLKDRIEQVRGLDPYRTIIDIDLDYFGDAGTPRRPSRALLDCLRRLMDQAGVVTIATSPEFIDQTHALGLLKELIALR